MWHLPLFYYSMPFQRLWNSAIHTAFKYAAYDGTMACTTEECAAIDDCYDCSRGFCTLGVEGYFAFVDTLTQFVIANAQYCRKLKRGLNRPRGQRPLPWGLTALPRG